MSHAEDDASLLPSPALLLFDFDGTLADTRSLALEILNELAEEFRFSPIPEEDLPQVRHTTIHALIKELGISKWRLPFLTKKGIQKMKERIDSVLPIEGIPEMLRELAQAGWQLGIVTSNSTDNVAAFLKRHQLEYFSWIESCSSIFGKARTLRRLLKKQKWNPAQILYIGDEVRDLEATESNNIPMAAVSWGYNSAEALRTKNPLALFDHPHELLQFLQQKTELVPASEKVLQPSLASSPIISV